MDEATVTFVVNYDDPEKQVEGKTKTRHFPTEHEASTFVQDLDKIAPKATNVHLTKVTCRRERIY